MMSAALASSWKTPTRSRLPPACADSHSHQLRGGLGGVDVLPGADNGKPLYTQQHQQGLGLWGTKASPEMAFELYVQGGAAKMVVLGMQV
jgi:hypothetical protein